MPQINNEAPPRPGSGGVFSFFGATCPLTPSRSDGRRESSEAKYEENTISSLAGRRGYLAKEDNFIANLPVGGEARWRDNLTVRPERFILRVSRPSDEGTGLAGRADLMIDLSGLSRTKAIREAASLSAYCLGRVTDNLVDSVISHETPFKLPKRQEPVVVAKSISGPFRNFLIRIRALVF